MTKFYQEAIASLSAVSSVEELRLTFKQLMNRFGLDCFTYQIISNKFFHNLDQYYVTTFPKEWERRYLEADYFDADPLVSLYKSDLSPFAWQESDSSLVPDRLLNKSRQMFDEAANFNLNQGIGVPLHGPNNAFSILTLCSSSNSKKDMQDVFANFEKDVLIASLLFHNSLTQLDMQSQMHHNYELTHKELECLKWVCAGKSNSVIGSILGISETSVKDRMKNIFKKMNVDSRHQAMLKAMRYKTLVDM